MRTMNTKKTMTLKLLGLTAISALAFSNQLNAAPIVYSVSGATVSEDFNKDLPAAAATLPWTDGGVFTGWNAQFANEAIETPDEYRRTSGGVSSGLRIYQWRNGAAAADGALGAVPVTDTDNIFFAVGFTNTTGGSLNEFSIGYTGQQWYEATGGASTMTVDYQFGDFGSNLTGGTWTSISALDFTSPKFNAAVSDGLNGTLAENSNVFSPVTVSSLDWQDNEQLWIRFTIPDTTGVSQGLAIDNFNFVAVPEPSAAIMVGLGLASLALRRSRRFLKA